MKIFVISIGTRGDMEPFLAIGELLKEKGHRVICAFPEQFRPLAEESHLEYASLGTKLIVDDLIYLAENHNEIVGACMVGYDGHNDMW